jgi:hypothetical protein
MPVAETPVGEAERVERPETAEPMISESAVAESSIAEVPLAGIGEILATPAPEDFPPASLTTGEEAQPVVREEPAAVPAMPSPPAIAELPAAAPVETRQPATLASSPAAPAVAEIGQALEQSGLVLVETDPSRVRVALPEAGEPETLRGRRERRPPPTSINEPLVQIETRK